MKKILFALFLLTSFVVNAKEITVTATGSGKTRDFAIMDAVENAVRQSTEITIEREKPFRQIDIKASGEYTRQKTDLRTEVEEKKGKPVSARENRKDQIDSHKITANVEDNSKEILAKYNGTIQSYQILEETKKDDLVYVTISAVVIKDCPQIAFCETMKGDCSCYICEIGYKLTNGECLPCDDKEVCGCTDGKKWSKEQKQCVYDSHDYKSKNLVKKAEYSLAVLPFKTTKQINCLGKKVSADELNTLISNAFVAKLTPTRKFNLVDRNNFDNYASELSLIMEDVTLPENKVKLKNIITADYILVGTVENFAATSKKEYLEFTGETTYESSSKLKISFRILETATMEIISAGSVEKKFSKDGPFSSCYNVEELLINKAVSEASEKLLKDIFPDYQTPKQETKKTSKKAAQPAKPIDYSLPLD